MEENEQRLCDATDSIEAFIACACAGDLDAIRRQVGSGFHLNGADRFGDPVLGTVIHQLDFYPEVAKYDVVRDLIRLGADPNPACKEGSSPLFSAVLNMDTEMLRILLDEGADPNAVTMDSESESLYDWAEFDYRYEVWDINPPEEGTPGDRVDEDAWLQYLDRLALKYGKRRPDHLQLLRDRGALMRADIRKRDELAKAQRPDGFSSPQ